MAAESLTQPQSLEFHLVTLFEKLDELRRDQLSLRRAPRPPMQTEIRTLEFWRAIISECTSAFLYVLLVCGAAIAGAVRATGVGVTGNAALAPPTATIAAALASGFAMAALTQCFGNACSSRSFPRSLSRLDDAPLFAKRSFVIRLQLGATDHERNYQP